MDIVKRWGVLEIALGSHNRYDNPFTDVHLRAALTHEESRYTVHVRGFYDGESTWRLRFMPDRIGAWRFETASNDPSLSGVSGAFTCIEPSSPYLHGPLVPDGCHFVHADGTRRFLVSTRLSCHLAGERTWLPVLQRLKEYRINRVLLIMGGTESTMECLYGENRDFDRYRLASFQAIDAFVAACQQLDMLVAPYFYYFNGGLQRLMTSEQDRAYIRYGMARIGAYANVMPVLANEVEQRHTDRLQPYDLSSHIWAHEMGRYLKEQAVFGLPVAVHNPLETENAVEPSFYTLLQRWDFPWASHMLRQAQVGALGAAPYLGDEVPEEKRPEYSPRAYARHNELLINLRRYGVPVVNEEPGYEMVGAPDWRGRLSLGTRPWNSQTSESLVPTFWTAATAGAYAMWGNPATYVTGDPMPWLERSVTPKYLRVLHDCVSSLPYWQMSPANGAVSAAAVESDGVSYRTNFCLAKPGEIYLVFSLLGGQISLSLPPDGAYRFTQMDPRTGVRTPLGTWPGGRATVSIEGQEQVMLAERI